MELERIKNERDMQACTFKPQIIKYQRNYDLKHNIHDSLSQQHKDYKLYEQARKAIELKDCSFQPTIDKNSEKIVKNNRESNTQKSYELLHKQHKL